MTAVHCVYGLVDPRVGYVFYVGVTGNPKKRLRQHMTDTQSAAYEVCQAIVADGQMPTLIKFWETYDRDHAVFLEKTLITILPQTYNRTYYNAGRKFWVERLAGGAPLQVETDGATKPWEAAGLSRATWYRQQKKAETT